MGLAGKVSPNTKQKGNTMPLPTTADMLAAIIGFNREMRDKARKVFESIEDESSAKWQEAYQIYRDCDRAYDDACRAAKYGFPGID